MSLTEVLLYTLYVAVGVPMVFILGLCALLFLGALVYQLFQVWWMILYLVTFSPVTRLVPEPPSSDGWYGGKR